MTNKQLYAAVRALPHMTITRTEDREYRIAYRLETIRQAKPEWTVARCKAHAERTSCYTDDREDALGSAKSLSDHMVGLLERRAAMAPIDAAQDAVRRIRDELANLAGSLDTIDHEAAREVQRARSALFAAWSSLRAIGLTR